MMTCRNHVLGVVAAVVASACSQANPEFCDQGAECPLGTQCDLVSHTCVSLPDADERCRADLDCADPTPRCEIATGGCVACIDDAHCGGTTPVCEANECRGCNANAECESQVCEPSGACPAPTAIAYVSTTGADVAPCAQSAPCRTVQFAWAQLDDTRTTLYLHAGAYLIDGALSASGTRAIVGPGGTTSSIEHSGATILAVLITPGSSLSLRDVTMLDRIACNSGALEAIRITARPSTSYALDLYNGCTSTIVDAEITSSDSYGIYNDGNLSISSSTVSFNALDGIRSDGGSIRIAGTELANNSRYGISANETDVTITGSTIRSNDVGGVHIGIGVVDIVNNFIDHNGNTTDNVAGGLYLFQPATGSRVEFNTIAYNVADTMANSFGGVYCDPVLDAPNNIIYNNARGADTTTPTSQVGGGCSFAGSLILDGEFGPDELGFVRPNQAPYDLHLGSAASPAVNAGQASAITDDIDGQLRPNQGASDVGADEYYP